MNDSDKNNYEKIDLNEEDEKWINKNILIIVYLKRKYIKNKQNRKKNVPKSVISFLSNYNQIFIDNLNWEGGNFSDFINQKPNELLINFINFNKIISDNIYSFYSYFRYKFKYSLKYNSEEINSKNYVKTMAEKIINNNESIIQYLHNSTLSFFEKKKNIMDNKFLDESSFTFYDDLLSSLIYYYEKEAKYYLLQLLFSLEKNQIIKTILLTDLLKYGEINNYIQDFIFHFPEKMQSNKIIAVERVQQNQIGDFFLNLKIPSIKNIVGRIIKYIHNIIKDEYLKNDEIIINKANNNQTEIDGREFENMDYKSNKNITSINKDSEKYLEVKLNLENKVKNEFNKVNLFTNLKENNNIELCKLLFNDYLIIFFDKYYNADIIDNYEKYKNLIYFFFNLKSYQIEKKEKPEGNEEIINISNNPDKDNKNIAKNNINFDSIIHHIIICEIYSDKLSKILNIINFLIKYFPKFNIQDLEEKIYNNNIYNNSKGEKLNIKEMFYIILQTILIYLSDENLGISFYDENTFFNFLREFQNICQIIEQLFIDFNVVSIEFYNLNIIYQLIKDISNYPGINYTKENLSQFLFNIVISLKEEKKYLINEENIENEKDAINKKLIDNFRDLILQIDIMYKSLKNNGYEIINKIKMFIYRKQINKIKNNDYIQEIISTDFNN